MDEVIEIFGKRLKIVQDNDDSGYFCEECAIRAYCFNMMNHTPICGDAKGWMNRHFEEVID